MKRCPNSYSDSKDEIIGSYNNQGTIVYYKTSIDSFKKDNLRFSSKYETKNCTNWTGSECSLPSKILSTIKEVSISNSNYLDCRIKKDCRWFYQEGIEVCKICPVVK